MSKPITRWGRNLQRLIRERGLKQGAVAVGAGLDKNAISRLYKATTTTTDTLERLAGKIGVDVADVFRREDQAGGDALSSTRDLLRDLVRAEVASLIPDHSGYVAPGPARSRSKKARTGLRRKAS